MLLKHNFGDTLTPSGRALLWANPSKRKCGPQHSGDGIASAHERVSFKHKICPGDMEADDHARSLFVDRLNGDFIAYSHPNDPMERRGSSIELSSEHVGKNIELPVTNLDIVSLPPEVRAYSARRSILPCQVAMAGGGAMFIGARFLVVSVNCSSFPQ